MIADTVQEDKLAAGNTLPRNRLLERLQHFHPVRELISIEDGHTLPEAVVAVCLDALNHIRKTPLSKFLQVFVIIDVYIGGINQDETVVHGLARSELEVVTV